MIQIDMEMPESCWDCAFALDLSDGFRCTVHDKKYEIQWSKQWDERYTFKPEDCPIKLVETTRNISGRNPVDKFACEKCGFMVDGWTAFNFEDETDDRFDYEFAFKFCPSCGRKVEI